MALQVLFGLYGAKFGISASSKQKGDVSFECHQGSYSIFLLGMLMIQSAHVSIIGIMIPKIEKKTQN